MKKTTEYGRNFSGGLDITDDEIVVFKGVLSKIDPFRYMQQDGMTLLSGGAASSEIRAYEYACDEALNLRSNRGRKLEIIEFEESDGKDINVYTNALIAMVSHYQANTGRPLNIELQNAVITIPGVELHFPSKSYANTVYQGLQEISEKSANLVKKSS